MKILHLNTYNKGGAYRATKRINDALNHIGIESFLLTTSDGCKGKHKLLLKIKRKLLSKIPYSKRIRHEFSNDLYGMKIKKIINLNNFDIIHFHWVADGAISLYFLREVLRLNIPIVWTLHDMHPFTGGCHYNLECEKYKTTCGECIKLGSRKKNDFTTFNQKMKIKILRKGNVTIVGCSNWITDCANNSKVMSELNCVNIPNCIDTITYKPLDKIVAQKAFNFKGITNKKVILFGAMASTTNERKGYQYLESALSKLDYEKYVCIIFGGSINYIENWNIYSVGNLNDDVSLSILYSCADVFVAPSKQENLANTVMESLSCGIPVVAFNIGGMPDMIVHKKTGYLANPYDIDDLATGIEYCCEHPEIGKDSRKYVIDNYSYSKIAKKYTDLYNRILNESKK